MRERSLSPADPGGKSPSIVPTWRWSAVALCCVIAAGLSASDADHDFFERKVRPVLIEHCASCHSQQSGKRKGGLLVDSRAELLAGGESGAAIVPGDAGKSLFINAISYRGHDLEMPPKGRLPEAVIADLTAWVKAGAAWPADRVKAVQAKPGEQAKPGDQAKPDQQPAAAQPAGGLSAELSSRLSHWAFQPMRAIDPPVAADAAWAASPIDRHIAAALPAPGTTAPLAEARTLARRLRIDLTGLPPTVAEVEAFAAAPTEAAYVALVDRLLATPAFAERWARHWMDVARYADSVGFGGNFTFDESWRYRDWVIDAIDRDMPYDRFLTEQIAGDLLPAKDPAERERLLVATGFLLLGAKELAEYDKEKLRMDVVDEQLNTIGQATMGLTIGCARCHDHKFDPISARDYYALAGILRSTQSLETANFDGPLSIWTRRLVNDSKTNQRAMERHDKRYREMRIRLADVRNPEKTANEIRLLEAELARSRAKKAAPEQIALIEKELTKKRANATLPAAEIERLEAEFTRHRAARTPKRVMAVREAKDVADTRIAVRGDPHNLGATVPRGFLSLARFSGPTIPAKASGRVELARWLTDPRHPLTARVFVNRVWHHLFGSGLVRTVDDFGLRGEAPSHPGLLDHLALEFIADGWSLKRLVRRIALSRAYRLGSADLPAARAVDPENRLIWRHDRRRLDAEALRDGLLAIGGSLDPARGGRTSIWQGRLFTPGQFFPVASDPWQRRTVYLPIYRGALPLDLLEVFDVANPALVTGRRTSTTVPTQALFLMNSPLVAEQAGRLADALLAEPGDDAQRLDAAYRRVLARPATVAERARDLPWIAGFARDVGGPDARRSAWAACCHALLTCNAFLFVD